MMKKLRKIFPFGPRVVKSAISVTLAILLARLITDNSDAIFFAAFGALLGIERSLSAALRRGGFILKRASSMRSISVNTR